MKLSLLLTGLSLLGVATARLSIHEIQVKKQLEKFQQELKEIQNNHVNINSLDGDFDPSTPPEVYWMDVELPIDHSGKFKGTFKNRYFVVDQYYKPGGPVFAFDLGEGGDASYYLSYLNEESSFLNQYLRQFNGLGIIWEHRYYGNSLPFPINLNTTSEEMQYLTIENSIKDFVVFAEGFKWTNFTGADLRPRATPWVAIGGSYSGTRAAAWRNLYPETVYAAYAASAPVEAKLDISTYWEVVYRGMNKYNLGNCTRNVHSAIEYIDSQLDKPETAAAVKQAFLGRTAEKTTNGGFAEALFYPLFEWQGSGIDENLREFCDFLELGKKAGTKDAVVGADGKKKGGELMAERWALWPKFVDMVNGAGSRKSFCEGPKRNRTYPKNDGRTPNCLLDDRFDDVVAISWTWQYCTEWGFFQGTNLGPHALGSRYSGLQYQQEICYRQFPDGLSSGFLPKSPRVGATNKRSGGWKQNPSNVFWTEGDFDPWRIQSPLSNESYSLHYKITQKIPGANVKTAENERFGYLLPGAEHLYDFNPVGSYEPAKVPLKLFADALKVWLPGFKKRAA